MTTQMCDLVMNFYNLMGWVMALILYIILSIEKKLVINLKNDLTCILFTILIMLILFMLMIIFVQFIFRVLLII